MKNDSSAKSQTANTAAKSSANLTVVPKGFNTLLTKLNDIPTLPVVATKVNELINNPNSSSADIAEVLKKDQVLTAKVLKLINSPYYGIPGEVTDVKRALAYLGFNTLAQLVLGMSVFSLFPSDQNEEFPLVSFWKHALGTAVYCEVIAKYTKYPKPEEVFTCGLLHDIGKIVMYTIAQDMLFTVVKKARSENKSFVDVERELDVPGHAFLGEHIATKWALPLVIRHAIRYHHHDVREMSSILPSEKPAIQMVTLANALILTEKFGNSGDYSNGGLQKYMYEVLNLTEKDLEEIKTKAQGEMKKATSLLAVYM